MEEKKDQQYESVEEMELNVGSYSDMFSSRDEQPGSEPVTDPDSPLYGTPWNTDEEVYDYVIQLRYEEEWEWENIKETLENQGLPSDYAAAILENTKSVGGKEKIKTRWRGVGELIFGLFIIIGGVWLLTDYTGPRRKGKVVVAVVIVGPWLIISGIRHLTRKF